MQQPFLYQSPQGGQYDAIIDPRMGTAQFPQAPGYRRLPDGTILNEESGFVNAPVVDAPRMSATAGPTQPWAPKRAPSPAAGPGNGVIQTDAPNPNLTDLSGYGNLLPGGQGIAMPAGRNYPALGQPAPELTPMKRALCVGAIVAVAAVTVWLQNRGKNKSGK